MSDASPHPAVDTPHESPTHPGVDAAPAPLDLDGIERDLADVEHALARLDSGEYWRDEVSGAELPDELLAVRPTARRNTPDQ